MTFRQFLAIVEIRTKIVSLSTYILASLYVFARTGELNLLAALLMLVAMLLVDMGTTGFNTYFDFRRGVDNAEYNREESKVVVHEGVPWGWALLTSITLFALALPLGIALAVISGWPVILVGAGCMAIGFFYTGGPYPISRTPFGELFAGGAMGSVLFLLIWFIHAGMPDWNVLLASLPSTVMIAAILTVNNTCDIEGDYAAGRKTLSIFLGKKGGETVIVFEVAIGFGMLIAAGMTGYAPSWGLLAVLPFAGLAARELALMHRRDYNHHTKGASMGGISKIFMLFTLAAIVLLAGSIFT